jgi:hypothetical protein
VLTAAGGEEYAEGRDRADSESLAVHPTTLVRSIAFMSRLMSVDAPTLRICKTEHGDASALL